MLRGTPQTCRTAAKKGSADAFPSEGGDEFEQVVRTSDSKCELLVSRRRAASFIRRERRISLRDTLQFGLLHQRMPSTCNGAQQAHPGRSHNSGVCATAEASRFPIHAASTLTKT